MEVTQNVILRISDQKTMELIDLYEKEECLWNTLSVDYKNRQKRLEAAKRIAEKLGIRYFEHRHVLIKFKNLRNSYCQELKKIAHSINSGAVDEEVYRPTVLWFSKMDSFLRPHLQTNAILPQCSLIEDSVKKEKDATEDWAQSSNHEYNICLDSNETHFCSDNDDSKELEPQVGKRVRSEISRNNKRIKAEENAGSHSQMELTNQKEDFYETFGKYVASLLRTLPVKKALSLQPRIVSTIISAATEQCEEESDDNVSS